MKTKRKPRPARCPTMVAMLLAPEVELTERMALQAFLAGTATVGQFDILADCRDLLTLAAEEKRDVGVAAVTDLAGIALLNIKDRYRERGRLGATGDERQALMMLVDVSEDFWRRQSGELFRLANRALDKARGYQREARDAAAG